MAPQDNSGSRKINHDHLPPPPKKFHESRSWEMLVLLCIALVIGIENAAAAELDSRSSLSPEVRQHSSPQGSEQIDREYTELHRGVSRLHKRVRALTSRILSEPRPPIADRFTTEGTKQEDHGGFSMADSKLTNTIFVSVASFRDLECPQTVRDLYAKATNPRRIFLGIIEQNEIGDPSCIPAEYTACSGALDFCPSDNIRIRRVRPHEAKGPTFGRWVAMLMFRDEKYFMMIDSHNRFLRNWDVRLISMYHLIPSRKGVLSHYPNSWHNTSEVQPEDALMVMCYAHFLDLGYVRLGARVMGRSTIPRICPYAAAGFLFAEGALVREVPFDPHLDFLFDGEEILYSVRMWTHGWDIYSPTESILFHYYGREGAPRVFSHKGIDWVQRQSISQQRVQFILRSNYPNSSVPLVPRDTKEERILKDLNVYGLGNERSLEDYFRFARIDPFRWKSDYSYCDSLAEKR